MIGIALGIAVVTFFTFESFDFDAKPPAKPQPVTPTYTQYMSCQQGDNYSDFAFGNMISGFNSLDIKGLVMAAGHTIVEVIQLVAMILDGNYFGKIRKVLNLSGTKGLLMNFQLGQMHRDQ